MPQRSFKAALFWAVLALFAALLAEGAAYIGLRIINSAAPVVDYSTQTDFGKELTPVQQQTLQDILSGQFNYLQHHPLLGWSVRPGGARMQYRANAQGLRGDRDYTPVPAPGTLRIAAFGDSFTHCDDVGNDQTWEFYLEQQGRDLEVLNFGVPAYGTDQAYLRYVHEGRAFRPQVVIIGFFAENIFRNVNAFRPFYLPGDPLALGKPRYRLDRGQLVLVPNPLPQTADYEALLSRPAEVLPALGAHDYFYQVRNRENWLKHLPLPRLSLVKLLKAVNYRMIEQSDIMAFGNGPDRYNTASEAFQVTLALLDAFVADVRAQGARPVVLVLPQEFDVIRYRRQEGKIYTPLLEVLKTRGYPYVDVMDIFERKAAGADIKQLYAGHLTPFANRLIGEHLAEYLRQE